MHEKQTRLDGLLLLNPGDSLHAQVHRYLGTRTHDVAMQIVGNRRLAHHVPDQGMGGVILDATQYPIVAVRLLQCLSLPATVPLAVYIEKPDPTLELFVRTLGVPMLLGPLSRQEWEALMTMFSRQGPSAELWAG